MGEVETEIVGCDERSGLTDVRAEDLAQRGMNEMGCGVIAADLFAALTVDLDSQDIADGYAATLDLAGMDVEVAIRELGSRLRESKFAPFRMYPVSPI